MGSGPIGTRVTQSSRPKVDAHGRRRLGRPSRAREAREHAACKVGRRFLRGCREGEWLHCVVAQRMCSASATIIVTAALGSAMWRFQPCWEVLRCRPYWAPLPQWFRRHRLAIQQRRAQLRVCPLAVGASTCARCGIQRVGPCAMISSAARARAGSVGSVGRAGHPKTTVRAVLLLGMLPGTMLTSGSASPCTERIWSNTSELQGRCAVLGRHVVRNAFLGSAGPTWPPAAAPAEYRRGTTRQVGQAHEAAGRSLGPGRRH